MLPQFADASLQPRGERECSARTRLGEEHDGLHSGAREVEGIEAWMWGLVKITAMVSGKRLRVPGAGGCWLRFRIWKASKNNTDYTDKKQSHGLHGEGILRFARCRALAARTASNIFLSV